MMTLRRGALATVLSLWLAGCGGSEGDDRVTASKLIGAAGGSVSGEGSLAGVVLEIPAGALDRDVTLTIEEIDPPAPPVGFVRASRVVKLGPDRLSFLVPIRFTLPFDGAAGQYVYFADDGAPAWTPVPGTDYTRSASGKEVIVLTSHFSRWAVYRPESEN